MGVDSPARFFVDENDLALGRSLALARKDVLHPGHARLPNVPLGTPDAQWLPIVGGLGLVVITRDKKIRSRPAEAQLVIAARHPRVRPHERRRPEHLGHALTTRASMGRDGTPPRAALERALARGPHEPGRAPVANQRLSRHRRALSDHRQMPQRTARRATQTEQRPPTQRLLLGPLLAVALSILERGRSSSMTLVCWWS